MMFSIYCAANRVNGKLYVGQTVGTVDVRWKEHVSAAKRNEGCRVFGAAIRKYGADSFTCEVLEVVATQDEADSVETKWITEKQSRVPGGYNLTAGGGGNGHHHEDSKRLIGAASRARWHKMTPEQQAKKIENLQTPNRLVRVRATNTTKEFGEKVRAGQKKFWAQLTSEERTRRVRHQQAGMSAAQKSDRVRGVWAQMTPEAREARVRKATAGVIAAKADPAHSKKMSEWQTAQAKLRTPEQRQAMVLKSWETRRAKYGERGHAKPFEVFSAGAERGWAGMSPEARAERVLKVQEGRRRAREAKTARLVRVNFLRAAA
jgi:group I intron endonuclease